MDRGSCSRAWSWSRLFRLNRIGYKLDAVISGFAIGAGFSVVENIFYLTLYPFYDAGTWLVRGVGTAVMHGTTLAILAAVAHELSERETREAAGDFDFRLWWFVPGYLAAVAIHTAFNQFPDQPLLAMLGAVVVRADRDHRHLLFRRRRSAALARRRRRRPPRPGRGAAGGPLAGRRRRGSRIAALADRLGPEAAKRVRRYWELQAWLIAEAEEAMMEEAAGDAEFDSAEIRAALAELDGLRRALGRSSFTALNALLPFSRNDYWELAELRQRLGPS